MKIMVVNALQMQDSVSCCTDKSGLIHLAAQTGEACSELPAVIIGREIAMSALRELAASLGGNAYKAVAVSSWGKWKTATQACSVPRLALSTLRVIMPVSMCNAMW
jgi:phosphatidylglycerophosphate synthase